jgi:hypothetical protein
LYHSEKRHSIEARRLNEDSWCEFYKSFSMMG